MSVAGGFAPTSLANGVGSVEETFSPFGEVRPDVPASQSPGEAVPAPPMSESPFGMGFLRELDRGESELLAEAAQDLLTEFEDEDFTDALEALVDEAAARHVADTASWSAPPSPGQAHALLEQWVEPLTEHAERALDALAEHLGSIDPHTVGEYEVAQLLEAAPDHGSTGNEVFDNFLGSLLRKAKSAVSGAVSLAKRGLAAVGRLMPINLLLGKLKQLIRPLIEKVVTAVVHRLPPALQPLARTLASKLGLRSGETGPAEAEREGDQEDTVTRLAEEFDTRMASLLLAPQLDPAAGESPLAAEDERDPAGELDDARARLAEQLVDLPPGKVPTAEIEQFIPAVLAVRPLVKLGISMIGRDRVVGFIADRVGRLIQPLIGEDAARQLSRPLVDVGLRALGFEASASAGTTLAGEALASTVEGTVMRLTELPAEAFADELQLESAVRTAFAEAAAASVPAQLLRPDLPERETAGETGVWILMPRSARPHYRRYSRVIAVPVTRQLARAVPWSDGGTLESYLVDRGVESWPVPTEVQLYEALPGTQLGHLAADEAATAGEDAAGELQPLTPEIAGLLLREPGLGRASWRRVPPRGHYHHRPWPGRRYFRVRPLVGAGSVRTHRPRRRVAIWLDLAGPAPALRVAIRLTEQQGHQLLNQLDPAARRGAPDLPGALTELTNRLRITLPARLARRFVRAGVVADVTAAAPVAERVVNGVVSAVSMFLSQRAHLLTAAMRDPAPGATIVVTFAGISKQSLATTLPAGQVSVHPGWHRNG
jgi:hypothetical protein